MTETEFRVEYSRLIEYYQYIEMRLKGICAALMADEEKGWFDRLYDYESDPFGVLIRTINLLQSQKQTVVLSEEDVSTLNNLRKSRNYWVTSVIQT